MRTNRDVVNDHARDLKRFNARVNRLEDVIRNTPQPTPEQEARWVVERNSLFTEMMRLSSSDPLRYP